MLQVGSKMNLAPLCPWNKKVLGKLATNVNMIGLVCKGVNTRFG